MNPFVVSLSSASSKTKAEIGVPALELAELLSANVPIPAGFVITQNALEHFAEVTLLDNKVKQLHSMGIFSESSLTKLILETDLPKDLYNDFLREYSSIAGISNIWLRIRAGLYDNEGAPLTFIDEFEINEVKGFEALELEIKKLWAKLLIIDQKYDSLGSFIIIQKLVPAEVSGIVFTQDKQNENKDHIIVKTMFGEFQKEFLSLSDTYTFSKSEEKIIDRIISPQKKMFVRSTKSDFGFEEVEISEKWQVRQKLSDKYIEDLGYLGDYLENVFSKPQEVLWVFQAGKIWINYVRPITQEYLNMSEAIQENIEEDMDTLTPVIEENAQSQIDETVIIDLPEVEILNEKLEQSEIEINDDSSSEIDQVDPTLELDEKEETEIPIPTVDQKVLDIIEEIQKPSIPKMPVDIDVNLRAEAISRDVLVAGVGNNKGAVYGKVIFNVDQVEEGDILVISEWTEIKTKVAGIVIEDLLTVSTNLPIIYGADLATKILREGEIVKLDTDTGFVFESDGESPVLKVIEEDPIEEEISNIDVSDIQLNDELNDVEIVPEVKEPEIIKEALNEVKIEAPKEKAKKLAKKTAKIVVKPESAIIPVTDDFYQPIVTATKVFANVNRQPKEDIKFTDGYVLNLPHAEDYLLSKNAIDYKGLSNVMYNYALPFLQLPEKTIIYNFHDINPMIYVKNSDLLLVQCETVHKLRNKEKMRHLYVALPKFKNLKQLRDFRKSLSASGLRRSTTFKIYIKIAYSSNIFELPNYLEDRFDGVIVCLEALHNSLYSSDKKLIRVTNTLITTLDQIQRECKKARVPMILDMKGVKITRPVLAKLTPYIHYGISVLPKYTNFTKQFVADVEKKKIFR